MAISTSNNSLDKEVQEYENFVSKEFDRISQLPEKDQESEYLKLHSFARQAQGVIRSKAALKEMGYPIEQQQVEQQGEGSFGWIMRQLDRLNTAKNAGILAITGSDPTGEYSDIAKSALTGGKVRPVTGAEVLEKEGVGQMGSLSDALPFLFSSSGEGLPLQKGGVLDISGRGAAGFAGDVLTDPLNLLFAPMKALSLGGRLFKAGNMMDKSLVGMGAGAIGKLVDKGLVVTTGKNAYKLAYESDIVKPIVKLFNKYAFLSPSAEKTASASLKLKELETGMVNLDPKIATKLRSNADLRNAVIKLTKDQDTIVPIAQKLDDITAAVKEEGYGKIKEIFPDADNYIKQAIDENGSFNFEKFRDIFLVNSGLTPEQIMHLKFVQNHFKDLGKIAQEKGLLKLAEIEAHPFWFPRKGVDLDIIAGNDAIEALRLNNPEIAKKIEASIMSAQDRALAGDSDFAVSRLFSDKITNSTPYKNRIFKTALETADFVKALGGTMVNNISELVFGAEKGMAKFDILSKVEKDLRIVFGSKIPKETLETLRMIVNKGDPESIRKASRMWNKWFLNPFKKSVTLPFPAFTIRNGVDNTIEGFTNAGITYLNPQHTVDAFHVLTGSAKDIDLGNGITKSAESLLHEGINKGVWRYGSTRSDLMRLNDNFARQWANASPKERGLLAQAKDMFTNGGEYLNTWADNHSRIKSMIIGTKEYVKHHGIESAFDPRFQDALNYGAKQAQKAFFDYRELGPLDDILAQFIPFYRFTRKNIPFQITQLAQNPHRIAVLAKAENDFNVKPLSDEQLAVLQPYLKEGLHVSLGDNDTGEHIMLSGTGLRIEQLNQLMSPEGLARTIEKATIGQAAPPLQFIYSYITNRNPYFGTELTDFRARNTFKAFYDNKFIRDFVGGIDKQAYKVKNGEVEYRYELQDPDQYAKVMSVYSPFAAALAMSVGSKIPGLNALAPLAAGALSPRGISTLGSLSDKRMEDDFKAVKAITGLKLTNIDFNKEKMRQLYKTFAEQYQNLRTEVWQKRQQDRVIADAIAQGIEVDSDVLPGINLEDTE